MKSTARIAGHPIHPMLIPYPFALLSAAAIFDVIDRVQDRRRAPGAGRDRAYGRTAGHLQTAGLLSAVVAAVPGIVDYFGTVPRGSQAGRQATWHAAFNSSALATFLLAQRERQADGATTDRGLGLALLGTVLLGAGGWLGGHLVYHHHIGVDDRSPATRLGAGEDPRRLHPRTANM